MKILNRVLIATLSSNFIIAISNAATCPSPALNTEGRAIAPSGYEMEDGSCNKIGVFALRGAFIEGDTSGKLYCKYKMKPTTKGDKACNLIYIAQKPATATGNIEKNTNTKSISGTWFVMQQGATYTVCGSSGSAQNCQFNLTAATPSS